MFKIIILSLLFSLNTFSQVSESKNEVINTEIFLGKLARSGGAGNGGNILISEFFKEALVSLEIARFSQLLSESEVNKVKKVLSETKVYLVQFQLCDLNDDSSCYPGYAAKNYPEKNIILLDSRDLEDRWVNMTSLQRKRLAFHEVLGLAGIEVANHVFSTQINTVDIFNKYQSSTDINRYFQILNDLFFMLPESRPNEFEGSWGKKTVVQPRKALFKEMRDDLTHGQLITLQIHMPYHESEKNIEYSLNDSVEPIVEVVSTDFEMGLWGEFELRKTEGYLASQIQNGIFQTLIDSDDKSQPKWKGKIKKYFSPSFPVNLDNQRIPELSCKMLDDNKLICRHIRTEYTNFASIRKSILEYSFYDRIKLK